MIFCGTVPIKHANIPNWFKRNSNVLIFSLISAFFWLQLHAALLCYAADYQSKQESSPSLCRKAEKCSCFHRMQNGSGFTNCTDCIHQRTMCLKYAALFKNIAAAVALLMVTRLVSSKIFFISNTLEVECAETKKEILLGEFLWDDLHDSKKSQQWV